MLEVSTNIIINEYVISNINLVFVYIRNEIKIYLTYCIYTFYIRYK